MRRHIKEIFAQNCVVNSPAEDRLIQQRRKRVWESYRRYEQEEEQKDKELLEGKKGKN